MRETFKIGDVVIGQKHRRYEPGEIIGVATLHKEGGRVAPLYRIAFPSRIMHLEADEIRLDPGRKAWRRP